MLPKSGVFRIEHCRLVAEQRRWGYAQAHAAAIDRHWQRRSAESPSMFNGVIRLADHAELADGRLAARFVTTDFKSYLYWREAGFPEAGVRDVFGSALLRSAEGYVILGRQRTGNVNSGQAYLPGGFIDQQDIGADGSIDIDASIARELSEETGLAANGGDACALRQTPGYLVTIAGPLLSIAREYRSPLKADELSARVLAHIGQDPQSELVDAVAIRESGDLERQAVPAYARALVSWVFANEGAG